VKDADENEDEQMGDEMEINENENSEEYLPNDIRQKFLQTLNSFYEKVSSFLVKEHNVDFIFSLISHLSSDWLIRSFFFSVDYLQVSFVLCFV
jgi:hypothetical protein